MTALIVLMIIVSGVVAGLNVYNMVAAALSGAMPSNAWGWFTYIVLVIVGIAGVVVGISMLLNSRYEVTSTELILRFGLIATRYAVADMVAVHVFKNTKKLTVYFKDDRYAVVVVKEEWYKSLIEELIRINPRIAYGEEEENDNDGDDGQNKE